MHNIVFLGAPGSGKGTQIEKLKKYNFTIIALGALLREQVAQNTIYKPLIEQDLNNGKMVPDSITFQLAQSLIENQLPHSSFLFDGFPRTMAQALFLTDLLKKHHTQIDLVLFLDVPKEKLLQRIKKRAIQGRADDQDEEKIKTRMHIYEQETLPLIHYYQQQNLLHRINGDNPIDKIAQEIQIIIDNLLATT